MGGSILYRGYENGLRVQNKIAFQPTIYLKDPVLGQTKDLFGTPVTPKKFGSMYDAKQFVEKYKDAINFYGIDDWVAQFIYENFPQNKIPYDANDINVVYLDIEVNTDGQGFPNPVEVKFEVDCLTIKSSKQNEYHVFTLHNWDPAKSQLDLTKIKVVHHHYKNERELLLDFLRFWRRIDPDVITGWFVSTFDVTYLHNRVTKVLGEEVAKQFSPVDFVNDILISDGTRESPSKSFMGISVIDYADAFKKFAHSYPKQETYKLNHIANVVLGEKKLDFSEYGGITTLATRNPQLYVDYNIKDVQLVERMEEKIALLALIFQMSYEIGCNYQDVFGTVKQWEITVYRYLMSRGIVLQPHPAQTSREYEGAYVNPSQRGLFEWVMSVDLASLYPNIAIQWNMGPETLVDRLPGITPDLLLSNRELAAQNVENYTLAANGCRFRKDTQSVMGQILTSIYADRKIAKKKMLEAKQKYKDTGEIKYEIERIQWNNAQMSAKLRLNSWYGAMANKYFRHFNVDIAEAITLTGQLANQSGQRDINIYLNQVCKTKDRNYILAGDTDSTYFHVGEIAKMLGDTDTKTKVDFFDKLGNEVIMPIIRRSYDEIYDYAKCYENRLDAVRDVIADRAVWTGAKKRYIMNVWDAEGVRYTEPDIKMVGVEAIRSSTPATLKMWFKDIFKLIMTTDKNTVTDKIEYYRQEWDVLLPEEIAFPTSANNLETYTNLTGKWYVKDYKKGCPINVRAAHAYNCMLRQFNVENSYPSVQSGDKIKYLMLRLPNPSTENVIAFVDKFPDEFKMDRYIDRETQWQKGFISPLEDILEACGYSLSNSHTFE